MSLKACFQACFGLFEDMTDNERVTVPFDLLGRKVRVIMDRDAGRGIGLARALIPTSVRVSWSHPYCGSLPKEAAAAARKRPTVRRPFTVRARFSAALLSSLGGHLV